MNLCYNLVTIKKNCNKIVTEFNLNLMNVKIRKRLTSPEKTSINLEITKNGKRNIESLGLFIYNFPKNKLEVSENKKTMELANIIRAERLIQLQDKQFGTHRQENGRQNFLTYFKQKTDERIESSGNYGNWDSTYKHLIKCFGEELIMDDVTIENCTKFQLYLKDKARSNGNKPLSQNTKYSYLNKLKACLKLAYKERLINENVSEFIKGFKQDETNREYLTFEEIQKLVETKCMYPVLKKAFLFSCLTGIRWSDIQRLNWVNLRHSEKRGYELSFRQQKTGGKEYLPISEQAVELLGERKEDYDRLFVGLKYSAYINVGLYKWIADADIKKKITFHCARHTHAVLLLENGSDIYTVSKMLGHREIKTTQIYAKIVDSKKIEAVKSIPKLNFN
jgi:integrase